VNPAPLLILGLGNDLLKDDAVGIRVAEALRGRFPEDVEVRATSQFGLSLMDELLGREKALLIDSYLPEDFSGARIQEWTLDDAGAADAVAPHFVGLGEVRETMRQMGCGFPREVRILAVPVLDPLTFCEEMSPEVAALVAVAAARARLIVSGWLPVEMAVPETASGYSER
jgi:hydrogenase maturation protease